MTFISRPRWKYFILFLVVAMLVGGLLAFTHQRIFNVYAQPTRAQAPLYHVLFDNAHAETAGNADWVISKSQPDPLGENAHPKVETDWTGGISAWGVTLQLTGRYSLMTNTSPLTYGTASNPLDLSKFNALVAVLHLAQGSANAVQVL